jgi:uncharacterized protein YybS (DUF2232 family)
MKTINARAMMEGAILAALTAIMGMLYNVPVIGAITMLWAVPIIIVGYRNGFRVSLIAALIAAIFVSIVATPIVGIILFVTYAFPGAIMGYMMRKQVNLYMTLVVCGLILSITIVLEFILGLQLIIGTNIIDILGNLKATMTSYSSMINTQITEIVSMYRKFGIDEDTINQVVSSFNASIKQFVLLLPGTLIATGIILSYLNFKVVKWILGRMGYKIEDVKKFSMWSIERKYRYIVLGVTFALLLINSQQMQFLYGFYTNLWVLFMLFYTVLGLSVMVYFIEQISVKYEIQRPVKALMLVGMPLLMLAILPYVGMFDIAADVRRLDRIIPGGAR